MDPAFAPLLFVFIFAIILLPIAVLILLGQYKIYEKAGEEGWKCLIPVYRMIVLLKIVGKPWWWLFLMMIPEVGAIWYVWTINMLSKSFGESEGFTVGIVLLPYVFYMILGFNNARYLGPYGDPVAFNANKERKDFDFDNDILNS